jgi:hypothetical protein
MNSSITWSETSIEPLCQPSGRWGLASVVFWQVALVSAVAFISQTLIFDETNWYRIDVYDALTWGLIVTQIFTLAVYVSRHRVQTFKSSLKIFLSMGALAVGLTVAAIAFLIVDAYRGGREILPLLLIVPGYCIAVFVFLVSMFLQLRLAIICLQAFGAIFGRKQAVDGGQHESIMPDTVGDGSAVTEKYSIADIFAFTGLAAVSISAYRLVLGMVTDYDALRFLAMFYAASITAFCVYGLNRLNTYRVSKLLFVLAAVFAIGYAEFYIATQFRSPLLRFGLTGMLLCNALIAAATTIQMRFLGRPGASRYQRCPHGAGIGSTNMVRN